MKEQHISQWLEAYHDGELSDRRIQILETHLETCASCQQELAELQILSSLLAENPQPENLTQPDTFVAQVALRLPRNPRQTTWQSVLRRGWQLAPLGILGVWVFIQATFLVTGILMWLIKLTPIGEQFSLLVPGGSSLLEEIMVLQGASLLDIGRFGIGLLRGGGPLGWSITLNIGLTVLIGLLYLSWLASWWVQKTNGNHNTSTSYNGLKGVTHES